MFLKELTFSYDADFSSSLLVVDVPKAYAITAFQINMIANNTCPNVLKVKRCSEDNQRLLYDVTSMMSLKVYMKRKCFSEQAFLSMLKCYLQTLIEGKNYYLNERNFIIDLDRIYIDPATGKLGMVYIPVPEVLEQEKDTVDFIYSDLILNGAYQTEGSFDYIRQLLNLRTDMLDALNERILFKTVCDLIYGNTDHQTVYDDSEKLMESSNPYQQIDTIGSVLNDKEEKTVKRCLRYNTLIYGITIALMILLAVAMKRSGMELQKTIGVLMIVAAVSFYCQKWVKVKCQDDKKDEKEDVKLEKKVISANFKRPENQAKTGKYHKEPFRWESIKTPKGKRGDKVKFPEPTIIKSDSHESIGNETVLMKSDRRKRFASADGHQSFDLKQGSSLLGRQKDLVDYWIEEEGSVGRVHAEIICEKTAVFLRDMNSKNGTFINGERIKNNEPTLVEIGDKVRFGGLEFHYEHHEY